MKFTKIGPSHYLAEGEYVRAEIAKVGPRKWMVHYRAYSDECKSLKEAKHRVNWREGYEREMDED